MISTMEKEIEQLIIHEVIALNRSDLFRKPIIGFSSVDDERYKDLKRIIGEWHQRPEEILPGAKSVISYFVPFTENVVEEPRTVDNGSPLWSESYVVINDYFKHINQVISDYLIHQGYTAEYIPATHTYDPKILKATWSHRSAAAISGLGDFGLNRMLITKLGCGGRFGTIITSASLAAAETSEENKCLYVNNGSCTLCIDICPADALKLSGDFDKFACQDVLVKNGDLMESDEDIVGADTCGKCISICPVAYME